MVYNRLKHRLWIT